MELLRERWTGDVLKIRPKVKNLFYKGNINLLLDDSPKLAIVGSRRMSDYGARVIEKWMPILVRQGITIVSGFMYGVDQAAHKACIENGGKTIAVLGWGIDNCVSGADEKLYDKILEVNGLILSEWQIKEGARWTFPQRNRIVAGISDAVLVIEGAQKSGSMITASLAQIFGKKLMALPGPVINSISVGTNKLIRENKAVMVTAAEDILKEMGLEVGQQKLLNNLSGDPLLRLLSEGERGVDEIVRILGMELSEVLGKLTELSIVGVIGEREGKFGLK